MKPILNLSVLFFLRHYIVVLVLSARPELSPMIVVITHHIELLPPIMYVANQCTEI